MKALFLWLAVMMTINPIMAADYLSPYTGLLSDHVSQGEKQNIPAALVDYEGWAADPRHQQAMEGLRAVDPKTLTGNEAMAFWINAYNLLTIDLIITTGERESIKNQGSLFKNVWKSHYWTIDGIEYTLDEIEHEILRPMGDPRIHVAINCASLSCPDLHNEPYRAEILDQQLTAQRLIFLENSKKGVAKQNRDIILSRIFKWFEEDFADTGGVLEFVNSYLQPLQAAQNISGYFDYNWNLNSK